MVWPLPKQGKNLARPLLRGGRVVLALALSAGIARAVVVSVTDATNTFQTLNGINGGILSDPTYDQQTGQGPDDFVGDGTNGYYGFYYKFGQINGVDSLVFRFRFNTLSTQQGQPSFTGNPRIGVDGDGDGDVDLYFGIATGQGQTPTIVFQNPTAGSLNISPNTSGLYNNYGTIAVTSSNYSYTGVDDGSAYYENKVNTPTPDAFLTFAIPFATFSTYLANQTGIGISQENFLRFVAFTSTQGNAVNQDVYGIGPISQYGDIRYDQGGGFSDYMTATGRPIPEPTTWLQLGAMLLSAFGLRLWWRKRARTSAEPLPPSDAILVE